MAMGFFSLITIDNNVRQPQCTFFYGKSKDQTFETFYPFVIFVDLSHGSISNFLWANFRFVLFCFFDCYKNGFSIFIPGFYYHLYGHNVKSNRRN